jgi:hypothetical protein
MKAGPKAAQAQGTKTPFEKYAYDARKKNETQLRTYWFVVSYGYGLKKQTIDV